MALEGLRRKLTVREQVARVNEERFEAWQYDRRLRDEITDQTERLAAPMNNIFRYRLAGDDLQTDLGESFKKVLDDGLEDAEKMAAIDPDWQFEVRRRKIERFAEFNDTLDFARLGTPEDGVAISSTSLDGSNYRAMQAIVESFGSVLPDGLTSEEILDRRYWLGNPPEAMVVLSSIPDAVAKNGIDIGGYNRERKKMLVRVMTHNSLRHSEIIDTIRDTYDQSLAEQFGGVWFGGREKKIHGITDAKDFIEKQTDLLADHMMIVQDVYKQTFDAKQRLELLNGPRYNLAAALDDRLHRPEDQMDGLAGAGARARSEGKNYDGDCPTGIATAISIDAQASALGYQNIFGPRINGIDKCVNCPFCKKLVDAQTKIELNPLTNKVTLTYTCLKTGCKIDKKSGQRIDLAAKQLAKAKQAVKERQADYKPAPK